MASIITYVRRFVTRHALLPPGQHVLLGVSGGADSVAMLHALAELAPSLQLHLYAAHLDHRIRGKASAEDAAFVREVCRRMGVPCFEGRTDVPRLARRRGLSLEAAAREARYAFFARTCRRIPAADVVVATAHTADDQAETVLLKLIRGAGIKGLSGIARDTTLHGLRVVRPMLAVCRRDILRFLRGHDIAWREDASNRDTYFLRNRVRHCLLPMLKAEFNPQADTALVRTADIFAEEDLWLDELAAGILDECAGPPQRRGEAPALNAARLARAPRAARRRVLRLWLARAGVAEDAMTFDAIAALDGLLARRAGTAQVSMAGGWKAVRQYDRLTVLPTTAAPPAELFRTRLQVPGETLLQNAGLRALVWKETGICRDRTAVGTLPAQVSIDPGTVGRKALYLRSWRAGDRISPLGLRGTKKLQDVFVDAKIPAPQRSGVPVLECAGEIVWVAGYRVARGWKVKDPRSDALQVLVERT